MIRCAFNSHAAGLKTPAFGVQIAQDGGCSNVNILSSNFDMYRVTGAHVRLLKTCKGFTFVGNYIEGRDDGTTDNLVILMEGDGVLISGNRLTAAGSNIDYNIQVQAMATGVTITGNYFEGAQVACVRIGNGASNVFVAGNATNGVMQVKNQNPNGSKRATVIEDGVVTTDNVVTS